MIKKDYYKILEISKTSTHKEIKKAYKKLALKYHPDKNHTPEAAEKFRLISEAYKTLSDNKERHIYERNRKTSSKPHFSRRTQFSCRRNSRPVFTHCFRTENSFKVVINTGCARNQTNCAKHYIEQFVFADKHNNMDIFSIRKCPLIRQNDGHNRCSRKTLLRQDSIIEYDLYISMEDILKGCVKHMKVTRKVLNDDRISFRKESKILNITVKPGCLAETRFTFNREGDQNLETIPADIVFIIKDKPHPHFKRNGSDVIYTAKISFIKSLFGVVLKVPSLTGDTLRVPLNILQTFFNPDIVKRISGHGLPFVNEPKKRGNLIIYVKTVL